MRSPLDLRQPGRQRDLVSVVLRQVDADHVRIFAAEIGDYRPRRIARAVVDEDDLVRAAGGLLACRRGAAVEFTEAFCFVEAGGDGRDERTIGAGQMRFSWVVPVDP